MASPVDQIKKFFHLLEQFNTDNRDYQAIFHPEIVQIQYANLLIQETRQRTFSGLMAGAEAAKKMLAFQRFEPINFFETPDTVIAEFNWTGELKVKAGKLKQGQVLSAHICTIFEFKDGKIFRQRNYDCYEPT